MAVFYRLRYAVYIDLVQQGSGPMAGQSAVEGSATGAGGQQTVAVFNGGGTYPYQGALSLSGNLAPQIQGSGTNGALANADLATMLMGAATIGGTGNGVTTLNFLDAGANTAYVLEFVNGTIVSPIPLSTDIKYVDVVANASPIANYRLIFQLAL